MTDYNKPIDRMKRILVKECELYATPTNFGFTGICPCGGRIACHFTGKKPNRTSVSTCRACGRTDAVKEHG